MSIIADSIEEAREGFSTMKNVINIKKISQFIETKSLLNLMRKLEKFIGVHCVISWPRQVYHLASDYFKKQKVKS